MSYSKNIAQSAWNLTQRKFQDEAGFLILAVAAALLLGVSDAFAQDTSTTTTMTNSSRSEPRFVGGYLEPMLLGSTEQMVMRSSPGSRVTSDTTGTNTGYGLGLKAGIHLSEFFIGVDGRYDREQMNDSFYQTANANVYNYGPTAGFQMPYAGLRFVATYVTGGQFNADPGVNGLQLNFQNPTGWRAGLGFHVEFVSLNLEYQDLTYDYTQVASLGTLAPNSRVTLHNETNGYLLSLSFPTIL